MSENEEQITGPYNKYTDGQFENLKNSLSSGAVKMIILTMTMAGKTIEQIEVELILIGNYFKVQREIHISDENPPNDEGLEIWRTNRYTMVLNGNTIKSTISKDNRREMKI